MRITRSADWRDTLTFDVPLRVADVAPGAPARCASCPADAGERDRAELWVVKHRHPTNPAGFVRFYCAEHTPQPPRVASDARRQAARAPRQARAKVPEVVRAMCPNCFVEVSATGDCGICGERAA